MSQFRRIVADGVLKNINTRRSTRQKLFIGPNETRFAVNFEDQFENVATKHLFFKEKDIYYCNLTQNNLVDKTQGEKLQKAMKSLIKDHTGTAEDQKIKEGESNDTWLPEVAEFYFCIYHQNNCDSNASSSVLHE